MHPTHVPGTRPYPWPYDGDPRSPPDWRWWSPGARRGRGPHGRRRRGPRAVLREDGQGRARCGRGGGGAAPLVPVGGPGPRAGARAGDLAITDRRRRRRRRLRRDVGFFGSALDVELRRRGIDRLAVGGLGLESAVDSTLGAANDRGYECLTLTDAVAPPRRRRRPPGPGQHHHVRRHLRRHRHHHRPVRRPSRGAAMTFGNSRRRRPLPLALRRGDRPGPHRPGLHRLAGRLLRPRRLRRHHGLRPQAHPGRPRAHGRGAGRLPGGRDDGHPHPGGPPSRPVRLPAQQAVAVEAHRRRHRRRGPVRPHPRPGRAGLGDRARGGADRGRADHRQAGQGLVLRHRPRPACCAPGASPT